MGADAAELMRRTDEALRVASDYAMNDGAHHKQWVIDQIVRHLTGCTMVRDHEADGPGMKLGESDGYRAFVGDEEWDEGVAP